MPDVIETAKLQVVDALAEGWVIVEIFDDEDGVEWVMELPDSDQAYMHIRTDA